MTDRNVKQIPWSSLTSLMRRSFLLFPPPSKFYAEFSSTLFYEKSRRTATILFGIRCYHPIQHCGDPITQNISGGEQEIAILLSKTFRRVVRFTTWTITCFDRSITAKYLLKRKGMQSTLYLGVAKESPNRITAHAWLRCGNIIVTGKEEMGRFTRMVCFT